MSDSARMLRSCWLILLLAALCGCEGFPKIEWPDWGKQAQEAPPTARLNEPNDPVHAGTIGELTLLGNVSSEPVRGFGIVVGLGDKGSSDCPTALREYLLERMTKQMGPRSQRRGPSPSELLDSLDSAVVEIRGARPPGAPKGTPFDVQVVVVPGTSTQSLSGGVLLPTPLSFYDPDASGTGMFEGEPLAAARGPVFANPFGGGGDTGAADLRRGVILGGARVLEQRLARLTLRQPRFDLARDMERRLNERFGQRPPTAEAESAGYLTLHTPRDYAMEPAHFLDLVPYVLRSRRPDEQEARLRGLVQALLEGMGRPEEISLAFEAGGRACVPHVQPVYTHDEAPIRFCAARAGLRIGDVSAIPVLGELAVNGPHAVRLLAIEELGNASSPQAPLKIAPLLDDAEREVRIAAYEALLKHAHPAIRSQSIPLALDRTQLNFALDTVETRGSPLIYVRRTRMPRIAVFGQAAALVPPIFYVDEEDTLTIHTIGDETNVRIFMRRNGRLTDEIVVPPRVTALITALADVPGRDEAGQLRGLGLPYARVVQVVAQLCDHGVIKAGFVLEQTSLSELLGPETTPRRAEGDPGSASEPTPEPPPVEAPPEPK